MNWARPELLNLLWAVPLAAGLFYAAARSRRRALAALGPLMSVRVSERASRLHAARAVLWTAALACFAVALAQPRWGFRWQELRQEGLSLVVVLDVSRSMDAQDVSPSRLERARREVRDLAGMLAGDRVGLVLSAGGAYAQMPLTLDYAVLDALARRASTDTLRAQGSDLGAAIDKAAELLGGDGQASDQAILLISDGEDHAGTLTEAAQRAADAGIHLYTVGVGTPDGSPIPLAQGGFKKDRAGQVVISRLDEDALRQLAEIGQGAYVRSVAGAGDMRAIYLEQIRGTLTAAEQGVRRDKIWTERYALFLGAGLLLLLSSYFLRPGALRMSGAAVVLLALVATPARAEDLDALLQQQAAAPDDMALAEQVGASLFEAGRYAEAARLLEQVAARGDASQRERARYNAGVARYGAGQLTAALEDWQQVLSESPENAAAQQNAAAVQAEIQARLQQQQDQEQQQQNSDQQDQGEPQDQQDQQQQDQQSESQDSQQQDSQDQQPGEQPEEHDGTMEPQQPEEPPEVGDTGAGAQAMAEPGEQPEPSEPDGEQTAAGEAIQEGEMSEDSARRLLESVEEGEPRVQVGDQSRGGNDW